MKDSDSPPAALVTKAAPFACHLCGGEATPLEGYATFRRVSSDCRPWPAGGVLGVCAACGALVVCADARWRADCTRIYEGYEIYHQSGGVEQVVAQSAAAEPVGRSRALLEHLRGAVSLPARGRLLDVGCGNGGFLRGFTESFPGWSAVGSEFDAKHRAEVESIHGVEKLHVGELGSLGGGFDLISLVHVLEHLCEPAALLRQLRGMLRPGGRLLLQLPYYVLNPIELLIADHATHFSAPSLRQLLVRGGWTVRVMTSDWIPKELSCVAEPAPADGGNFQPEPGPAAAQNDRELARNAAEWIASFRAAAQEAARQASDAGGTLGIFGTAIAGVWLAGELADSAAFFVDEDPARVGKTLQGLPVLTPGDIPRGATVFMGVSPVIAERIAKRIQREDIRIVPPPENPC